MCAQEVDFRGNHLGDNGAMIIGRSMRQMQSSQLAKIDLGYNEIMDDGAFTIANVRLCSHLGLLFKIEIVCFETVSTGSTNKQSNSG